MAISILSDISSLTIVMRIASYSYRLLKYFRGYWQAMKIILLNKMIPDENFPNYGNCITSTRPLYSPSLIARYIDIIGLLILSLTIFSLQYDYCVN